MMLSDDVIDPVTVETSIGSVLVKVERWHGERSLVQFTAKETDSRGGAEIGALYIETADVWPDALDPENDRDFPRFEAIAERFGKWAGDAYREHGPDYGDLYTDDWRKFYSEPPEDESPKEYRVRWEIDVTATSPKEAALQVWRDYMFQFIDGPQADVFDVIRNGKTVRVDLSDPPEEEESEE